MPNGTSVVAKEINATTWEFSFKLNGKVTSKSKVTLNGTS